MIEEHKFGSFKIDGKSFLGDIKIINKKVRYWDNREKHILSLRDIKELLAVEPDIIIVGTGNTGLLEVDSEVKTTILLKGIKLFIEKNAGAIEKYNSELSGNKKVAAIFHATC